MSARVTAADGAWREEVVSAFIRCRPHLHSYISTRVVKGELGPSAAANELRFSFSEPYTTKATTSDQLTPSFQPWRCREQPECWKNRLLSAKAFSRLLNSSHRRLSAAERLAAEYFPQELLERETGEGRY